MQKPNSCKEYFLTFTSVYRAIHGKDQLQVFGIQSEVQRVPTGLSRSCGYGLYVAGEDIRRVMGILKDCEIYPNKVFEIYQMNGKRQYRQII